MGFQSLIVANRCCFNTVADVVPVGCNVGPPWTESCLKALSVSRGSWVINVLKSQVHLGV